MELEVLSKVLVEVLGVDASEIHSDTTFLKDLGADSLDIFQIVVRLQEELNVTFDPAKVEKIETVEQALLLIKQTKSNG
ncbi:MAG: acyl carrier protein [Lachnospiraceae bacterium]|nr:acyl carrier protein [Lachnospiraceae bacterium]